MSTKLKLFYLSALVSLCSNTFAQIDCFSELNDDFEFFEYVEFNLDNPYEIRREIERINNEAKPVYISIESSFDTIYVSNPYPKINVLVLSLDTRNGGKYKIDGSDYFSFEPLFSFENPCSYLRLNTNNSLEYINFEPLFLTVYNTDSVGEGSLRDAFVKIADRGGEIDFNIQDNSKDTIDIYAPFPTVSKSITISSNNLNDSVVLNGLNYNYNHRIMSFYEANSIQIRNLNFKNFNGGYEILIDINGSEFVSFNTNTFENLYGNSRAISIDNSKNVLIKENKFLNVSHHSLWIDQSDVTHNEGLSGRLEILKNLFHSNDTVNVKPNHVIVASYSKEAIISDNLLSNCFGGLLITENEETFIYGNHFQITNDSYDWLFAKAIWILSNPSNEGPENNYLIGENESGKLIPNSIGGFRTGIAYGNTNKKNRFKIIGNYIGFDKDMNPLSMRELGIDGSGESVIRKNVINTNESIGIFVRSDFSGIISNNFIGISQDNYFTSNRTGAGIHVSENVLALSVDSNIISNNSTGILITKYGSVSRENEIANIKISNNSIGTSSNGKSTNPNINGIYLNQSANSKVEINNNIISGNLKYGLRLTSTDMLNESNHLIIKNKIGWSKNNTPMGNGSGGIIVLRSNYSIGSTYESRNFIANNNGKGIEIDSDGKCKSLFNEFSNNKEGGIGASRRKTLSPLMPKVMKVTQSMATGYAEPLTLIQLYENDSTITVAQQGQKYLNETYANEDGFWSIKTAISNPKQITATATQIDTISETSWFSELFADSCNLELFKSLIVLEDTMSLDCNHSIELSLPENPDLSYQYSLYRNGELVLNSQAENTVTASGSYYFKVINPDYANCHFQTNIVEVIDSCVTGYSEFTKLDESGYPNPFVDFIIIEIESLDKVNLLNSKGEHLSFEKMATESGVKISTEDLSSGIYFIEVIETSNRTIKKMIKL